MTSRAAAIAVTIRRRRGSLADATSIHLRPARPGVTAARQAESAYRALTEILADEGATTVDLVRETIFFGDLHRDLAAVLAARTAALVGLPGGADLMPPTCIAIPPADAHAAVAISAEVVVPRDRRGWGVTPIEAPTAGGGPANDLGAAVLRRAASRARLQAANIDGHGADALTQLRSMFGRAEELLRAAGLRVRDLTRTWIYVRDIARDYDALNRARRDFFQAAGLTRLPASTAVQGGPVTAGSDFAMSFEAVAPADGGEVVTLSTPTLNEASTYGADFARGVTFADANQRTIHLSGTASIDEQGRTVHSGDVRRQAERMLLNIESLLTGAGASPRELCSAVVYVKHHRDAARVREVCDRHGLAELPLALVVAPLCRTDLLCEAEAVALLPLAAPST